MNFTRKEVEEINTINEIFQYYIEHKLNSDKEDVTKYILYLHESNEINDEDFKLGKYDDVFNQHDRMLKFIENKKSFIFKIKNKLIKNTFEL